MKIAQTQDGKAINAAPNAPKTAVCPLCGGLLTLRSRRAMNRGKTSYFWRHSRNQNQHCRGRRRPV